MMVTNPFVRLFEAPVETLTLTGYVLGLLCLLFLTLAACWRNAIVVKVQFDKNYPNRWQYNPPTAWLLRVAAIPLVLMVDVWALAAVILLMT